MVQFPFCHWDPLGPSVVEDHTWRTTTSQPQSSNYHGGPYSSNPTDSLQSSPSSTRHHLCNIKPIMIFCSSRRLSLTLALSRSELFPFPYLLVGEEQLQEGLLEEVRKLWLLGCGSVGLVIRDVCQSRALGRWPEKHPLNSTDLSL